MTDKLRECPFCGGNNVDVFNWEVTFQGDYFKAYCKDCDFELKPQRTEEEAIEAWNIRKPMDRIVEEVNEIGRRVCNNVKCNHECVEDSERICDHGVLMGAVIDAIVKGVQNE